MNLHVNKSCLGNHKNFVFISILLISVSLFSTLPLEAKSRKSKNQESTADVSQNNNDESESQTSSSYVTRSRSEYRSNSAFFNALKGTPPKRIQRKNIKPSKEQPKIQQPTQQPVKQGFFQRMAAAVKKYISPAKPSAGEK